MKKLAITISGAVSLGAYEAGVMFELLQALQAHNTAHADDPILIDVITGASAGGMTAVILAQKLLFQPSRLQAIFDNDLYLPWVKDIDLVGLLALNANEPHDESMLSSDLVEAIGQRYLIEHHTTGVNIQREDPHPAVAPQLKIGLAMSNLNGIDYGLKLLSGGSMPYTRFQDEVKVDVDSTNAAHDTDNFWEPLRNAAVACGAFPFAFRVKGLRRHASDYQEPAPLKPISGTASFAYTDGGTFQNEPIGLAKQLVDDIDQHVNEERYFLFVAPGMRTSASNDFTAGPESGYFNYWNTGQALINAIFNQARYRDLQEVERINQRITLFDQQALGLQGLFLKGVVSGAMLGPATKPLLDAIYPGAGGSASTLADDQTRLRSQFQSEYDAIKQAQGQANADAWIDAILLLETAASLGHHDTMNVYAITEDRDKLAGDDLCAFGGFFDATYRQHDYDTGRQSVRDFITWLNGLPAGTGMGPIDYQISNLPTITIDHSLDGVKLEAISISKRRALYDRVHDRVQDFMEEIGINAVVREGIDLCFLNGHLKKLFAL